MAKRFIQYFEDSFRENWDLPAMTNYATKQTYAYKDVAREIAKLHILFRELNIQQDDKIALVGNNTPEWAITFLATITYGAVIVPILQTFNPNDICYVLEHSNSKILFVTENIWSSLERIHKPQIRYVFSLPDYQCLFYENENSLKQIIHNVPEKYRNSYSNGFSFEDICYPDKDDREMCVLSYTSGTSGFSKGVMLNGLNFITSFSFSQKSGLYKKGYKTISYLFLAHIIGYGCDVFMPVINGCEIFFIPNMPSPLNLINIMKNIEPSVVAMVPLYVEKICDYLSNTQLNNGECIKELGCNLKKIIIGGALLSTEVEQVLCKMKIPYLLAYAMTECCIITVNHSKKGCGSVGKPIENVDIRIDSKDPTETPGEILVKGENVMMGYYRNNDLTISSYEGNWFKTGDMGILDDEGYLYIKGRNKAMILTSSGQNIYPEEIEYKLNQMQYVIESLVIQREGKIIAWIYPDFNLLNKNGIENIKEEFSKIRKKLNKNLAFYENVSDIIISKTGFEKSSKGSIKRYLYK